MQQWLKAGFVLLLAARSQGLPAMAQSPGTFTATGDMTTTRSSHTATLLHNGKVLIAGGGVLAYNAPSTLASAELYDPSTGKFTATGSMTAARYFHSATLLPNGKVLMAGGAAQDNGSVFSGVASAELYDPSSETFTPTGDMSTRRWRHSATLLNSGKVLIGGGTNVIGGVTNVDDLASAELYDPATGKFTATGKMTWHLGSPLATLLSNGKVWIAPGDEGDNLQADQYDPETGAFSPTGWRDLLYMVAATTNLLANGKVLVTLNLPECDFASTSAELYDFSTGTFMETGNMLYGICRPKATMLPDATVLIAGGWFGSAAKAQVYDPVSSTFSGTGDMTTGRHDHTVTLLNDGTVLMTGGSVMCCDPQASAEIYHPAVLTPAPVLFSLAGDGKGHGAVLHAATHQTVSASRPAIAGESLEIYLTGLLDGSAIPPQVAIGGRLAQVLFFGSASGFAGLNQVNVRVPSGVATGSAVPVRLTYIGRPSNEVTIAVEGK